MKKFPLIVVVMLLAALFSSSARAEETSDVTLQVKSSGPGAVLVNNLRCAKSCQFTFPKDSVVLLEAKNGPGAGFIDWSGGCFLQDTFCLLQMTENKTISAEFAYLNPKAPMMRFSEKIFPRMLGAHVSCGGDYPCALMAGGFLLGPSKRRLGLVYLHLRAGEKRFINLLPPNKSERVKKVLSKSACKKVRFSLYLKDVDSLKKREKGLVKKVFCPKNKKRFS